MENEMALTQSQIQQIETKAKETAQMFVDEFSEPLNPAQTDWDATVWQEDRRHFGLPPSDDQEGWKVYQRALVNETRKLTGN